MKKVTIGYLLSFCLLGAALATESITPIDHEALFAKYKAPSYKVSMQKINGLTFEQTQAYLISDIYDYVMSVQKDYIEKNKTPIKLFYPAHTREKIQNNIFSLFKTSEDLTENNINSKVNAATIDYLKVVHQMNQDPVYKTINELYFETLTLKERVSKLEASAEEKLTSPQSTLDKDNKGLEQLGLTFGPIVVSLAALIIAISGKKKTKT